MEDHMKFLTYVAEFEDENRQKVFERKVKRAENKMKEQRTNALKLEREMKNRENLVKLQAEMKARMNRVVKKIGKKDMQRSEQIKKIENKVVEEIDQDTEDQLYYLGLNLSDLEKQQAALKQQDSKIDSDR